jgi:hypothetical protein
MQQTEEHIPRSYQAFGVQGRPTDKHSQAQMQQDNIRSNKEPEVLGQNLTMKVVDNAQIICNAPQNSRNEVILKCG